LGWEGDDERSALPEEKVGASGWHTEKVDNRPNGGVSLEKENHPFGEPKRCLWGRPGKILRKKGARE